MVVHTYYNIFNSKLKAAVSYNQGHWSDQILKN